MLRQDSMYCFQDKYNVTIYDPQTQETRKMGLGDATEYFNNLQNDFLCALSVN